MHVILIDINSSLSFETAFPKPNRQPLKEIRQTIPQWHAPGCSQPLLALLFRS